MPDRESSVGPRAAVMDRRRLLFGILPAAALLVTGCARSDADERKARPPLALVYNGPQGCTDCAPAVADLLRRAPRPFEVTYVGPGTGKPLTASALAAAQLYVQPGVVPIWREPGGTCAIPPMWSATGSGRAAAIWVCASVAT